jgi:hypothetical protein
MRIQGISYNVNWRNFRVGTSFCLPFIDDSSAKKEVLRTTKRLRVKVFIKVVIEEGVKGLRIWRI